LNKWAVEVAETGTFLAPLGSGGPGGLPVPYLVIANKVDMLPRDGKRASNGNLVDLARQWAEKQGLLRYSEELPLTESFPGNSGLVSVRPFVNILILSCHVSCTPFFFLAACMLIFFH
jgi:Rab-like protein 3